VHNGVGEGGWGGEKEDILGAHATQHRTEHTGIGREVEGPEDRRGSSGNSEGQEDQKLDQALAPARLAVEYQGHDRSDDAEEWSKRIDTLPDHLARCLEVRIID